MMAGELVPNSEAQYGAPGRGSSPLYVARVFLIAVAYLIVGKIGLAVPFTSGNVSPIWPAAGIGVGVVVLWGQPAGVGVLLGAFLINFLNGMPWPVALGIALGNTGSALLGAFLWRSASQGKFLQTPVRGVLALFFAATVGPLLSATVGAGSLYFGHIAAWHGFRTAWQVWWAGDAVGILLGAPWFILRGNLKHIRNRALEFISLLLALVVAVTLIFHGGFGIHDDVLAFVAFPFLIWAAIRFRIMGAACASLLVGGIATWSTARGQGPFVEGNPVHDVVLLQIFVVLVAATTILLAAVTEEREQIRERLADHAQLLDLASDAILVRGLDDTISYWNHGAERLYGWTRDEVLHKPVQELLGTQYPQSIAEIKATVLSNQDWNGELTHTTRDGRHISVASRWSLWSGEDGKPKGFLQLNSDITPQRRAEQQLRELTGRLLKAQDDERRRIARELHDSAGQLLAALSMNLASLQPFLPPGQAADICQESEGLVQQLMRELRTLSHLLHPPLLDEVGLSSAVQWFVEGFGERSHIQVALDLPEELERLPAEIETAIFRLIQEALTNIHRHSESPTATVRIVRSPETVRVEIADAGKGFAPELLSSNRLKAGVGIQGMRERIRQLGGQFEVTSGNTGTLIAASLPLSTT